MKLAALLAIATLAAAQSPTTPQQAVRDLIRKFNDTRNTHSGRAIAELYSEDAEIFSAYVAQSFRGRTLLAQLWGGTTGTATRTVNAIEIFAPNIAVARVTATFDTIPDIIAETFILVLHDGQWSIRLHQQVQLR
jgi:hypothetical protein